VYEAVQEKLDRPVALKLLPAVVSTAHPEFITRFRREATAAARLHHTNVIPIYDFGESRDGYYYAMELVNGQPLSAVIRRLAHVDVHLASTTSIATLLTEPEPAPGTMTPDGTELELSLTGSGSSSTGTKGRLYYRQVAHWMADVAEALHYAHLQGLIHRDIKPGNLMVCTDGRIMILDFGLVKSAGERSVTATGSLVGTYRYMSPEQVGAKRIKVDARSDVYSLGATMYELLTFCPAFPSTEQSELLSQILFKEPVPPRRLIPSVPVDLQTICLKALEKSPGARYQTAQAMADDLNSYLRDLAIRARPQGPLRRAVKFVRRRRIEAVVTVALLLVLSAGAVGLHFFRQAQVEKRDRLMKEGIARWQRRDWQLADKAFHEALGLNPKDYAALVNLANMYNAWYLAQHDAGLLDQADALLGRAIAVNRGGKDAWNAQGVLYQTWSRPQDAIAAYEKARAIDPTYYPVWVNLAMLQATQGNLAEAERCAARGVTLATAQMDSPDGKAQFELLDAEGRAMPWRILAAVEIYLQGPQVGATLETARVLSERRDPATLVLSAQYHLARAVPQDARKALDYAVSATTLLMAPEGEPRAERGATQTLPRAERTLALARLRNGQWELAAEAAHRALNAGDPQPAFAHLVLAVVAAHQEDPNGAAEHWRAAATAWPEALQREEVCFAEDGQSLWFDTRADLEALRALAAEAQAHPTTRPQTLPAAP
jgi:tetratricopeptide (TPR) repeat protein